MKRITAIMLCVILSLAFAASCSEAERPLTVEELLEVAERYLLEGNYEQALVEFMRVIEVDPMEPRGYTGAAESFIGLGRYDEAIDILQQGLTVLPGNAKILAMLEELMRRICVHNWIEANCLDPMTCTDCGKTEGSVVAVHAWIDATCLAPRTCIDCGETEGSVLEHSWREANFQQPQTCTECGEIYGPRLRPAWETLGYRITPVGRAVPYLSSCYRHRRSTEGTVMMRSFRILPYSEFLGLEFREGFEWRIASFTAEFSCNNSNNHGVWIAFGFMCFYTLSPDPNVPTRPTLMGGEIHTQTVNYNGEEFEGFFKFIPGLNEWITGIGGRNNTLRMRMQAAASVPIGFDGVIVYFTNGINWPKELSLLERLDSDSVFFRLR